MSDAYTGGPAADTAQAELETGPPAAAWLTLEPSDLHPEGGAWMDRADARARTEPEPEAEIEALCRTLTLNGRPRHRHRTTRWRSA